MNEYYDTIARCHVSGESTIFIEFMLSQIDRILEDISLQMYEENEQFSETVRKMLEIMKNLNLVIDAPIILSGYLAPYFTEEDIEYLAEHLHTAAPFILAR